jgi:hypothetical protein
MRTAILLRREPSGEVSLGYFQNPLEARAAFQGMTDLDGGSIELWSSTRGHLKTKRFAAKAKPAPVEPKPVQPAPTQSKKK